VEGQLGPTSSKPGRKKDSGDTLCAALLPLQPTLPANANDGIAEPRAFDAGNFMYQTV
jgi:hypothetical protein